MHQLSRRNFLGTSVVGALSPKITEQHRNANPERRSMPSIRVHSGGHLLENTNGGPFFWLADTAWELIHSTTRDECSYYLQTRGAQGFNTIQTVVLAELEGIRTPTPSGLQPFEDGDPTRPSEAYFDRVVHIVEEAAQRGLYVAVLPSWGDKVTERWGRGPVLFRNDNLPVARNYAAYLARKLAHCSNVFWMLGGDRPSRLDQRFHATAERFGINELQDWTPIWDAMANGILSVGPTSPLFLYHPQGGAYSTSVLMADSGWLSVNGIQSGHGSGRDTPSWELIARDYSISPPRPVIDLEPNYEEHPVNPWPSWNPALG